MMVDLVRQLRPHQWTKNAILFAGVIFSVHLLDLGLLGRAVLGFIVFCAVSSAVYCFNDIADLEKDRRHPEKRNRPLPSGRLPVRAVLVLGILMLAGGLIGAWLLSPRFALVAIIYFVINVAYSFRLKQVAVLDVILLSAGFVLRAVGSVEVLDRPEIALSPWLLLCTFFLAMLISAGKRRAELALLNDAASGHREALSQYTVLFLDRIVMAMTTAAILAYSIYTLAPGTQAKFGTHKLVYTVPFVVYGLFRYTYLVYEKAAGGNPTEAIIHDRPIVLAVLLWVAAVFVILYVQ